MKDQSDLQLVPVESDLYKDIIGYLSGRAGFDIKRYVERIEINKQREIYVDGNRINGYCSTPVSFAGLSNKVGTYYDCLNKEPIEETPMANQSKHTLVQVEANLRKEVIDYLSDKAGFNVNQSIGIIEIDKQQYDWGELIEIFVDGTPVNNFRSTSIPYKDLFTRLSEYYDLFIRLRGWQEPDNQEEDEDEEPIDEHPIDEPVDELSLNYQYLKEMRGRYKNMVVSPWVESRECFDGNYTFARMIDTVMITPMNEILDTLTKVMDAIGGHITPPTNGLGYPLMANTITPEGFTSDTMLFYTVVYNALPLQHQMKVLPTD